MPAPDETTVAAFRALVRAHTRLVERLGAELEAARDLPLPWLEVLAQLADAGGRLRMHELAERVLLSRSGLSRLVDRLEAAGHLSREACPDDGRGTFAVLTSEGRATLRRATPVHLRGIQRHLERVLAPPEIRTLRVALDRVADTLEAAARR